MYSDFLNVRYPGSGKSGCVRYRKVIMKTHNRYIAMQPAFLELRYSDFVIVLYTYSIVIGDVKFPSLHHHVHLLHGL